MILPNLLVLKIVQVFGTTLGGDRGNRGLQDCENDPKAWVRNFNSRGKF